MRIGLVDVDCHAGKKKWGATVYPNLALGKICAWHRAQGDTVEWAMPMLQHYDVVYRSKIFNFSPDDDRPYDADRIVRGGTGYDLHTVLPSAIDDFQPDFSLYPHVPSDVAYGFLTRGCTNHCPWCVVPTKEGAIRPYWDIERVLNGKRKAVLMDNNILAAGDYALEQLDKIVRFGVSVDFNQALDARLVNHENAHLLARIHWLENRRIRFGCDTPAQIDDCERAISLIDNYGFKGQYFLYTMIGHTSFREAYTRINHWRERNLAIRKAKSGNNVYPYAQPYRDPFNGGGANRIVLPRPCPLDQQEKHLRDHALRSLRTSPRLPLPAASRRSRHTAIWRSGRIRSNTSSPAASPTSNPYAA